LIICHEKKIIFIKTKKTAGTSFEIALSKFCGPSCIITPIIAEDEHSRRMLGFRTAQNYTDSFYRHIPADKVKNLVAPVLWDSYKKITIVRNPFDVAISRYYWEGMDKRGIDFINYLIKYPKHLTENAIIACIDGDCKLDFYLRYESMKQELSTAGLDYLWEPFSKIKAKNNTRPATGSSVKDMYRKFPEAIELVKQYCSSEISKFEYTT
jgi:hypothetical protein